jgi:hypothetical protein
MGNKVTFDPINRLIIVTEPPNIDGEITIDVNIDIYSDGKEDWLVDATLRKLKYPVSVVGGESISPSRSVGSTFFLNYGWKIRPYEADHTLILIGNLYTDDGTSPLVPTLGSFNVSIQREVSNVIDGVASPLEIASIVWESQWLPYTSDPTKVPTFGSRLGKKSQFGLFGK